MKKEQFEIGKAPHLTVECMGDLDVRSWGETAVYLKGDQYETTEQENGMAVHSHADLRVMLPAGAQLTVTAAHGDLSVKNVEGIIEIDQVMGDAALRDVGALAVRRVHGDLTARDVNGPCAVEEVLGDAIFARVGNINVKRAHGDCILRTVTGPANLGEVMGDASLKSITGDVNVGTGHRDVSLRSVGGLVNVGDAHGDIRLRGPLAPGKHHLNAQRDIVVRWPAASPISVIATGHEVLDRLGLAQTGRDNGSFVGHTGESDTTLILNAKGRIILKAADSAEDENFDGGFNLDLEAEIAGISQRVSTEINSRMAEMNSRMSELASRLERKFGPEFSAKIEAKAQKFAARAERQAERAMRHGRHAGHPGFTFTTAATKERKATEEEQLRILKMVENGVITPEEANTLLDALES
jgi:DUF4097 and DUF4098 domain-containing protein YvlB